MSKWWDDRFAWKPSELKDEGVAYIVQLSEDMPGILVFYGSKAYSRDTIGVFKRAKEEYSSFSGDFFEQAVGLHSLDTSVPPERKITVIYRHKPALAYSRNLDWVVLIQDANGVVWETAVNDRKEAMDLILQSEKDGRIKL